MPPKCFESEVESFLEGSHGDRTHNKQRADHHTVTPLCGTLLPPAAFPRKNSPNTPPPVALPRKSSPSGPSNANFGRFFVHWANFFALTPTIRPSRANFFAHEAQQHSDIETNNTTARPQQGSLETGITSAPKNCTKNAHFTPAKATTVSVEARPAPAKAMTVSTPYRYQQAKATPVSGERAAWSTGPRCNTRGRQRGLALGKSHAIRLGEVSTKDGNTAITTLLIHGSKEFQGNCMRNC